MHAAPKPVFSPIIATAGFYKLKEEASRGVEEVLNHNASSVKVDPKTGEKKYYSQGAPLISIKAHVYRMEGRFWSLPSGVELPPHVEEIMNTEEGGFLLTTGPFYVKREKALTPRDIRALTDREAYERFGLRRVYDNNNDPFEMPALGIGGRSMLLPVAYTVNKKHVFGIEFKGAGTPAYVEHNKHSGLFSTVFEEHVGKPGIFVDWTYQASSGYPVGLDADLSTSKKREKELLSRGSDLTRWTISTLLLFDKYKVSLRVPIGDYRRLSVFFDDSGTPLRDDFTRIVSELGYSVREYLVLLSKNYGKNFKEIVRTGIMHSEHNSIINLDILGNGTDFDDYFEITEYDEKGLRGAISDWVDNLVKVLNLADPKGKSIKDEALKQFAGSFLGGDQTRNVKIDTDDTMELKTAINEYAQGIRQKLIDRRSGKIKRRIKRICDENLRVLSEVKKYMAGITAAGKERLDRIEFTIDLSLLERSEEDLQRNIETWAYLILLCRDLDNVNFVFEKRHKLIEGKKLPPVLENEIRNAPYADLVMDLLRGEIQDQAPYFDVGEETIEKLSTRIRDKRSEIVNGKTPIEIPIVSKKILEWMRDTDVDLADNQYPVAMEGLTWSQDGVVPLRDFQSAVMIGLAKASLVQAKRRLDREGEFEQFLTLRTRLFAKLKSLYAEIREDIVFTQDTLDYLIDGKSVHRLNRAIELYLPPIVRLAIDKLEDIHKSTQFFLRSA